MHDIHEVAGGPVAEMLNAMNAGVYLTDRDRRIVFWNRQAERITGHRAEDVVGSRCRDGILEHVDKDGHPLCSTDLCPLYRAMNADRPSQRPVVVYARTASGKRIPVSTSVAPIHDEEGNVIGGVEVFQDESENMRELEEAKAVQLEMLPKDLPDNESVSFALEYVPAEYVGGDFCHIQDLSGGVYNVLVADVAGHGTASALYTAILHSLVDECAESMASPSAFMSELNDRVCARAPHSRLVTAFTANFDCSGKRMVYCSAGIPPALVQPPGGGRVAQLELMNYPLGVENGVDFDSAEHPLQSGDRVLVYTDGAVELRTDETNRLQVAGLVEVLDGCPPQGSDHHLGELYSALLERCVTTLPEDDILLLSCIIW